MLVKYKVSVIVPCFNYGHYLGEALDSVLAQTYTYWECIIVDDGSTDTTKEVSLQYCNRDSRIRYFWKENGGHSSARNFGIIQSDGTYVLLLDADDILSDIYLEKAVSVLEADNVIKIVTGQVQLFGDTTVKITMPSYDLRSYLITNYLSISSVFRRTDYNNTKGFNETMLGFEDWDFFISILKNGGIYKELAFTSLFYRKKENSMYQTVLKNKRQVNKDLLCLYNNHSNIYERFFDSPIMLIQENEKLQKVISNYQRTNTYKIGLLASQFRNFLFRKRNSK